MENKLSKKDIEKISSLIDIEELNRLFGVSKDYRGGFTYLNHNYYDTDTIKPSYYNDNSITPFDYIKANNLDFFEGNVIKYITRYKQKNGKEDLLKAMEYLKEVIKNYENI